MSISSGLTRMIGHVGSFISMTEGRIEGEGQNYHISGAAYGHIWVYFQ